VPRGATRRDRLAIVRGVKDITVVQSAVNNANDSVVADAFRANGLTAPSAAALAPADRAMSSRSSSWAA
jgi:hypothetical protein